MKTSRCGRLLKINGSQSIPVAYHIAHKVSHLYGAIAIFDPKLSGYVVSITHDPEYKLGTVLSDEPVIV
ncbi:CRISPR-associated protein Csx3 [Nostoc sp. C052]|uniref:CRISPR-associated protein Csx3 n=1 Tax=Nostoc sp. C052 TaxID=2576902 RepID=UPI0021198BEE|nr:CRISPR-associated protein Csx3 [Nostoc sp. C052]